MKTHMASWVLAALFVIPSASGWSADSTVAKMEDKYNELKVNANRKDVMNDHDNIDAAAQKRTYWEEASKDGLKRYNKALKSYGPSSDLTKDAKDRYDKATGHYQDARKEHADAHAALREDQSELHEAQKGSND